MLGGLLVDAVVSFYSEPKVNLESLCLVPRYAETLGPDGQVVNTTKYLNGRPRIAPNADPARVDGIRLRFPIAQGNVALEMLRLGTNGVVWITVGRHSTRSTTFYRPEDKRLRALPPVDRGDRAFRGDAQPGDADPEGGGKGGRRALSRHIRAAR
jgi:hypothetical protein